MGRAPLFLLLIAAVIIVMGRPAVRADNPAPAPPVPAPVAAPAPAPAPAAGAGRHETDWWDVSRTLLTLLGLIVACLTFVYNANVQWFLKQCDMATDYQKRFAGLVDAICTDIQEKRIDDGIFLRFWALQEEQFEAWLDGLLATRTYRIWVWYRAYEARQQINRFDVPGVTFRQGWERVKQFYRDQDFVRFIDAVLDPAKDPNESVESAFALLEPVRQQRSSRWRLFSLR